MINNNFNEAAWEAFQESAAEKYNFSTCQRPDGSYYGTSGTCRKGTPVKGPVPKKEKSVASMRAKDLKRRGADGENHGKQVKNSGGGSGGGGGVSDSQAAALSKDLTRQIGEAAKKGDKKAVDNLMQAKSSVDATIKARGGGVTATPGNAAKTKAASEKLKADKKAGGGVRQDRKEEAKRKEGNKAQKERDAKRQKNVDVNKKVEANNKKIEQLRKQHQKLPFGDKKKSAMMEEIDKLNKDTKSLLTRSTQGPQQRPQTGGAAGQRRAQAASNARD